MMTISLIALPWGIYFNFLAEDRKTNTVDMKVSTYWKHKRASLCRQDFEIQYSSIMIKISLKSIDMSQIDNQSALA